MQGQTTNKRTNERASERTHNFAARPCKALKGEAPGQIAPVC